MNVIKKLQSINIVVPKLKWVGGMIQEVVRIRGEVYACLFDALTGELKQVIKGHNLITDAGDVFYAERGAGATITDDFHIGLLGMGSAGNAPADGSNRSDITTKIAGSELAPDATYPLVNDPDGDNPGTVATDVITFRRSYGTTQANDGAIDRFYITNTTPAASEPILMYSIITSFAKTTSDTLKIYINHTFN